MKRVILILVMSFTFIGVSNAHNNEFSTGKTEKVENCIDNELLSLVKNGTLKSLAIEYSEDFSCTLSGEVSYNGVAIKLSITEDTCEKAGAGLAQATKAFIKEIQK